MKKLRKIIFGVAEVVDAGFWLTYDSVKVWVCSKIGHKGLFYRDRTICTRCYITLSYAED